MAANLRSGSGGLRAQSSFKNREDVDPMASVANLADVMLVFACGLMMALVSLFGVDLSSTAVTSLDKSQVEEVDTPEDLPEDMSQEGSSYIERGTLLQDPSTGKYYIKADGEASEDLSGDGDASSQGSSSDSNKSDTSSRAASPAGAQGSSSTGSKAPDRSAGAD